MSVSVNDQLCLEPRSLMRACARRKLDISWYSLPNRFMTAVGPYPGMAWLLLSKKSLAALDPTGNFTSTYNVHFKTRDGQLDILDLVFFRAKCLTPTNSGNLKQAYLVELRDTRHLAQNDYYAAPTDQSFNVRAPAGATTYYQHTLKNGTDTWTWQGILDALWSDVAVPLMGGSPVLPYAPDTPPENLSFPGVPAWQAYNEVLTRLGCAFTLSPTTGLGAIVQMGVPDLAYVGATARLNSRRRYDGYWVEGMLAKIPKTVHVLFHSAPQNYGAENTTDAGTNQWLANSNHTEIINAPAGAPANLQGAVLIWDDLACIRDAGANITNQAALTTRAQARADDYYRMVMTGGDMAQRIYNGIQPDQGLFPGSLISLTTWQERGDGFFTEIRRYPPPVPPYTDSTWMTGAPAGQAGGGGSGKVLEVLRQPDFGRVTFPNYPRILQSILLNGTATNPSVFSGTVQRLDPANPTGYTSQEACWVIVPTTASNPSPTARIAGRLNGAASYTLSSGGAAVLRPVYEMISGGGGGGFFAKIISGNNPYAWKEQSPLSNGTWQDTTGGRSGTTTVSPLYELNGATSVAAGTIVRVWLGYLNAGAAKQEYLFSIGGGGYSGTRKICEQDGNIHTYSYINGILQTAT